MTDDNEKKEEQPATEDTGEGTKPEVYQKIDDANLAAKRLEDANKEKARLQAVDAEIEAKKVLGGGSEAGSPSEKKEETNQEYVDKMRENGWKA